MPKGTLEDPFARLRIAFRQRRKELDLSISDAAIASHVGASKIRRLEEDSDSSPRLIHVARLAQVYGVSGDEIVGMIDLPAGSAPYLSAADGHDAVAAS